MGTRAGRRPREQWRSDAQSALTAADFGLKVRLAPKGKSTRAEPIPLKVKAAKPLFADEFPELEAELGAMVTGGVYIGLGRSPDRADAMAWAMAALSRLGAGAAGEEA